MASCSVHDLQLQLSQALSYTIAKRSPRRRPSHTVSRGSLVDHHQAAVRPAAIADGDPGVGDIVHKDPGVGGIVHKGFFQTSLNIMPARVTA